MANILARLERDPVQNVWNVWNGRNMSGTSRTVFGANIERTEKANELGSVSPASARGFAAYIHLADVDVDGNVVPADCDLCWIARATILEFV